MIDAQKIELMKVCGNCLFDDDDCKNNEHREKWYHSKCKDWEWEMKE